jgi:hypothetical protein
MANEQTKRADFIILHEVSGRRDSMAYGSGILDRSAVTELNA